MKVNIDKLDYYGKGITKIDEKVTFVPFVIPDEEVEIKLTKTKKKYNEAICVKINKENRKRQIPFCPRFMCCGGCNLQHMSYEETLAFKKDKIESILTHNKITFPKIQITPTKKVNFYRNKVSLKVKNGKIGFYKTESHDLVLIDKCLIAMEILNDVIMELKSLSLPDGEIVIRTNHNNEILLSFNGDFKITRDSFSKDIKIAGIVINGKCVYGDDFLITNINHTLFKYSYDSFFQVNNEVAGYIFDYIKKHTNDETVLDLYCGVGTLSLMASANAKKVYGIEIVPNAIKNALKNSKLNNRDNLYFMLGDVAKTINKIKENFDLIIVDPPRKGLDKNTLDYLIGSFATRIIYVSCDPLTLGRDLKILTEHYIVDEVSVYDMFPYTYHVETIVILKRK